jgi:hypothetical protein
MDVDILSLGHRVVVRIQVAKFHSRVLDKACGDNGEFAKSDVVVKMKAYEFRFCREPDDYLQEPEFLPLIWVRKDGGGDDHRDGGMLWIPPTLGWIIRCLQPYKFSQVDRVLHSLVLLIR